MDDLKLTKAIKKIRQFISNEYDLVSQGDYKDGMPDAINFLEEDLEFPNKEYVKSCMNKLFIRISTVGAFKEIVLTENDFENKYNVQITPDAIANILQDMVIYTSSKELDNLYTFIKNKTTTFPKFISSRMIQILNQFDNNEISETEFSRLCHYWQATQN